MSILSFTDRDKRVDTILISFASLFLLTSGFLILDDTILFQNIMVKKQQSQQNPIATLVSPENDVRKKAPSDLVWIPVTSSVRVIEKDTIFTGADSSAIVKFDDGTVFTLEPESMVIIERKEGEQANVEVARGGVSGKLGKNVKLKAQGNENFELSSDSGAEINLNMAKGGGPKVDVLSGNADFNTKTGKKKIAKNQTVEFGKGSIASVKKHLVDLLFPSVNYEILMSPKQRLEFKWKPLTSADNYQFELSKSRNFKGKYFKKLTKKLTFKIPRPKKEGEYFWRVKIYSKGQLLSESLPRKFKVVHEKPPQIILPNNNEVMKYPYLLDYINDYSKAKFEVNLKWLSALDINQTQLLIAKDKKFKKIVVDSELNETFLSKNLVPGKYFWKVRLNDNKEVKRTWSKTSNFEIKLIKSKNIPKSTLPKELKDNTHLMFDFSIIVNLEWNEDPNIQEYHLELSKNKEFKNEELLLKENLGTNQFSWETELKGKFFWRVRAVTNDGVVTPFSSPKPFIIKDPPPPVAPEIKEKTLEKEFGFKKTEDTIFKLASFFISSAHAAEDIVTAVDLKWKKVQRAVKYKIEISPTKKFTKIIHENEIKKTQYTWKHNQVGTYYWRVRAIDKKDIVGLPSKPGTIKLRFGEPEPFGETDFRYDINNQMLVKDSMKVKIEWTTGKYAHKYQIQMSTNKSFRKSRRFYSKENSTEVDISIARKYYWRVRSIDKEGRIGSDYSKVRTIQALPIINDYFGVQNSPIEATKFRYTEDAQPALSFNWKVVPYATQYDIEISQDPTFDTFLVNHRVNGPNFKFIAKAPLRPTFFWRIRGRNKFSTGIWSDIRSFTVVSNENLDIPEMIYPSENSFEGHNEMADVFFEWSDVEEALSYVIEIGVDKDFKFGKRVFLASNARAYIKLKTRSIYYYRIHSSYIIPLDSNVSELKKVPRKGVGEGSKIHRFVLNKGYVSQIDLELGFSNFSFTNDISTPTANSVEGTGKNSGLNHSITYQWYPQYFGGNWGIAFGVEKASSRLSFADTTNSTIGDFAYRQSDSRAFISYRTSIGRRKTLEFNFGAAKSKKSYPFLTGGIYESRNAAETYFESQLSLRWIRRKSLFHAAGIRVGFSTNSSTYYMPWYEMKYYNSNGWFGFKMKYKAQTINYSFDSTLPQSDSFNVNSTSFLFLTGIGF